MANKNQELIDLARARFDESYQAESANRELASEDVKFENGEQWDDSVDRTGRPSPVVNKVSGTVKQIIGDARQNRPRIKARPVDSGADIKTAEMFTGIIRNIENVSDAESAYDNGFECAVRGGVGYWRVLTGYAHDQAFEQDVTIKRIVNPFSVYFDQASTESDYSDARYCFVCEKLTEDEFKNKYPDAEPVDWDRGEDEGPNHWLDEGKKVRVAEYWYKEQTTQDIFELADGRVIEVKKPQTAEVPAEPGGQQIDAATGQMIEIPPRPAEQWVFGEGMAEPLQFTRTRKVKRDKVMWCKMSGSEILEGPQEWPGKYIPIVPCLGEEVWIGGERVLRSAIRFAKDPQRIYNWTRANSIEIMALGPKQPYIGTPKMFEGHESQWDQAHTRPMNRLLANLDNGNLPQRQQLDVNTTGIQNEAMMAADDIKATTGIFDASLGARGNETSGKAILARQRQGNTATFVFTDNQVRALKYTGKILVDLIPKIYDTQRVVRLLNEDGKEAWDTVNVTDATGKVVANDISVGRYDVTIDAGPGYATKRQEAAEGYLTVMQAAPQYLPILLPLVVKNLDWPGADELAQKLEALNQPQPQQPDPKAVADAEKTAAETEGTKLDNADKMMSLQDRNTERAMAAAGLIMPPGMAQPPQNAGNFTG